MEYKKIKDEDEDLASNAADVESLRTRAASGFASNVSSLGGVPNDRSKWKRKSAVTLALTFLTSSQAILIVWSKRAGKYEYSVTTANFMVEALKCALSLLALARIWRKEGVNDDNRLSTTFDEVKVYPIPAALYLVKNLLQYYIFAYVDAPGYQILKNFNIISTGVLYRIILKKKLSEIQWAAFILLCAGCTTAQLNPSSDHVLQTPLQGWIMAIVMALLSGFAGVYTEAIIKKRPSRNINVQNFWLYVFGMVFNAFAIVVQDFDAVVNKGFFHGYSFITTLMILNHALSGIAVSMVMKYADNIVKVYSTSVAMLLTAVVSVFLFGFHLSLAFFLGSTVVSVESPGNMVVEHSMTELLRGLQDKSLQLSEKYKMHHARSAGKGKQLLVKRNKSVLGESNSEDQLEPVTSGSSDDESRYQRMKHDSTEKKGQNIANRFDEALANSTFRMEGTLFAALNPSGVKLHGKLQQVIQSEKEKDADFIQKLQVGFSPLDEQHSFVVEIRTRFLEAKMTVCRCSFVKNMKASKQSQSSQTLADEERESMIIFSPRVCSHVDLDAGKLIRIHFPWKEVNVLGDVRSIIMATYFSGCS